MCLKKELRQNTFYNLQRFYFIFYFIFLLDVVICVNLFFNSSPINVTFLFSDFEKQTKAVPELLNENNDLQSITFENIYNEFNYSPSDNLLNVNYMTQNEPATVETEAAAKYAAVIEEQFEIANRLKDYAAVATENIPLQLSYNIGTENVENGKEGETLIDNTRVELEENSVITEFENAGINLCDIDNPSENFGFDSVYDSSDNIKLSNPNIIDVRNITPSNSLTNSTVKMSLDVDSISLEKQIYTPEALQMSLACDEEIPSVWDGAVNYTSNTNQMNIFKENMNENPLTAVPTTIQSYINLPSIPNTASANVNVINDSKSINNASNLLKELTVQAEICSCPDCKCTHELNCLNCNGNENISENTVQIAQPNNCSVNVSQKSCNISPVMSFNCPSNVPVRSSRCKTAPNQVSRCSQNIPVQSCCSPASIPVSNCSQNIPVQSSGCSTAPISVPNCSSNIPVQLSCRKAASNPVSNCPKNISTQPSSCNTAPSPVVNCSSKAPPQSSCCPSISSSPISDITSGCCGTHSNISSVANSLLSSYGINLKTSVKTGCPGVTSAIQLIKATNPDCNKKGDDCCVVICLKTMEQLKHMLTLASGCNNFQNITLGYVPNDLCGVPK